VVDSGWVGVCRRYCGSYHTLIRFLTGEKM
jgi:hypothetical protein